MGGPGRHAPSARSRRFGRGTGPPRGVRRRVRSSFRCRGGPSSVRKRGCYPRPVVFKTPGERGYGPPSEWSTLSSGDTWSERVGVPPPPSELFASPFPTSLSGNGFVQVTTSSAAQAFEGDRPSLSPCWAFPAADYCLRGRRLYRGGSASDSESLSRPSGIAVASGFESSSAMLCS